MFHFWKLVEELVGGHASDLLRALKLEEHRGLLNAVASEHSSRNGCEAHETGVPDPPVWRCEPLYVKLKTLRHKLADIVTERRVLEDRLHYIQSVDLEVSGRGSLVLCEQK